jgi:hypothetical protein
MANYTQIDATANIKPSAGKLIGIMVTAASSTPTITVYDSAATTTTTPIFKVFTPTAGTAYNFGVNGIYANNGIYIVISGTVSATVYYD